MVIHGQEYSRITAGNPCGKLWKTHTGSGGRSAAGSVPLLDPSGSLPPFRLSACSACAGDYQDPERTAPPGGRDLFDAESGGLELGGEPEGDDEDRGADDEFPADEA